MSMNTSASSSQHSTRKIAAPPQRREFHFSVPVNLQTDSFLHLPTRNMAAQLRAQKPTIAWLSDDLLAKSFAPLRQKDL